MDPQPSQSGRSAADSPASSSRTSSSLAKSVSDAGSQSLSSILNNPHAGKSDASWVGWWSSSSYIAPPEFNPIVTAKATSELARSDFQPYLSSISESYNRFEDIRKHASKEGLEVDGVGGGQGEALVACLREVPALYFKEDFALEEGATFRAACPFTNVSQNLVLQEKLSQYLDVVELHLVKEISLRSNSFFEAQVQLQDLNVKIVEGCKRIRELKETIRLLDADLVHPAREVQNSYNTRSNLLTLQRKLRLVLYVNQALSALKLLVASADCAGALDVTDVLQQLLEGDELTGLHCFRHLREHVAGAIDSVNSILSAEFMRASIHDAGVADSVILSKAKVRVSIFVNGKDELDLSEEDTLSFRDRLLPLVIGLLRTAKLPSVLRLYRDTLTADMKSAIKTAVEELLPALSARPSDTDLLPGERTVDADGGGSLASKLRSLSSESFVQLLYTIFRIVQAHLVRAAEVKRAIEWIMCNLDGHYAADTVAAAIALGTMAVESTQDADGQGAPLLPYSTLRAGAKFSSSLGKANDLTTNVTNISKNFRADVLRENTEAVFAACDSAHGRWAKLLGVRALLHPRLRLQEFLSIYNITHEFIHLTEKVGGRLGYSIRGTLQSQAKAFIDFQHESRMTKLKAVLDQETWAEVDVPDEFQEIVTSLFNSEVSDSQNTQDSERNISNNYDGVEGNNNGPVVADPSSQVNQEHQQHVFPSDSNSKTVPRPKSSASTDTISKGQTDVIVPASSMNSNSKDRGKPTAQMLLYAGVGYHMVNCGLILLKLLSEYIDMNNFLPALSSEVVHRVVEILKFFNTRTCQLVLGAGAMQVSGLKSITSKHLALASQVISFTYSIIPEIRRTLFLNVPEPRKALLLSEFNRVAEDYKVHRDEIHTKLVQIMRERLLFHLRGLRQIVESWNRSDVDDSQPSSFAQNLTKEIILLRRVLVRTLHEVDVRAIMRQVVIIVHAQISEAYYHLEFTTPLARERLQRDIKHILNCIRALPTDDQNDSVPRNWGQLDQFLVQRFGEEAV